MKDDPFASLRDKLDQTHTWPATYPFKFISPRDRVPQVLGLLPGDEVSQRPSEKGNYVSLTFTIVAESADDVIRVYERLQVVEGLISL